MEVIIERLSDTNNDTFKQGRTDRVTIHIANILTCSIHEPLANVPHTEVLSKMSELRKKQSQQFGSKEHYMSRQKLNQDMLVARNSKYEI